MEKRSKNLFSEEQVELRMFNLYGASKEELASRSQTRLVQWLDDAPVDSVDAVLAPYKSTSLPRFRDEDSTRNVSPAPFVTTKGLTYKAKAYRKGGGALDKDRTLTLPDNVIAAAHPETSPEPDLYTSPPYPFRERNPRKEGPPLRYRDAAGGSRPSTSHGRLGGPRRTLSSGSLGLSRPPSRAELRARPLHLHRPRTSAGERPLTPTSPSLFRSSDSSKWLGGDVNPYSRPRAAKTTGVSGGPLPSPITIDGPFRGKGFSFRDPYKGDNPPFISNVPSDTLLESPDPKLRLSQFPSSRLSPSSQSKKLYSMSLRSCPSMSPSHMSATMSPP